MSHLCSNCQQVIKKKHNYCQACGQLTTFTNENKPRRFIASSLEDNNVLAPIYKRISALLVDLLFLTLCITSTYILLDDALDFRYGSKLFYFIIISFIFSSAYFSMMESSIFRATFGKQLLNIQVVDINNNKLHYFQALNRFCGRIIAIFIFGLGFLFMFTNKKNQGLHDFMANSYVIKMTMKNKYVDK